MMSSPAIPRPVRVVSRVLVAITLVVAATAAYIVFVPIDATNFATQTGLDWSEFSSANPEASSYMTREARVLAVGYLALGLIGAMIAWRPLRVGDRWAAPALWVFSGGMLATSLIFFTSGDGVLGATYLVAAAISAGALVMVTRSRVYEAKRD